MKDSNRKWILTFSFIFLLIFIRIMCNSTNQILYIVYGINLIGMFYVIGQIMIDIYEDMSGGVSNRSLNTVLSHRNKKIRGKFARRISFMIIVAVVLAVVIYLKQWNNALGIINDVIALLTLGLSIEDKVITKWILNKMES